MNNSAQLLQPKKSRSVLNQPGAMPFMPGSTITKDMVIENKDFVGNLIDFFISYPDLFLDMILPKGSKFAFYYFQRKFLRANTRYRYFFGTFTRAYSKSFLSILIQVVKCVLQPGTQCFICTNVKSTAVKIALQKLEEIWQIWPLLKTEVLSQVGTDNSDHFRVNFKNGSAFDVLPISDSSRGLRRHGGIMEEAALIDGDALGEIIIPVMNISRNDILGQVYPDDPMNQQQIYITTAASKSTFAYEQLIDLLIRSAIEPDAAYICGGDYRLPVSHGLMSPSIIRDIRLSETYKPEAFAREYLSIWNGSHSMSWISGDKLAKHRKLLYAEKEGHPDSLSQDGYYVMTVDVGRSEANSAIHILKVQPREHYYQKSLVNTFTLYDKRFNEQASFIKQLYKKFLPKYITVDGTGVGIGLCDFLTMNTVNPETGEIEPPLGIYKADDYKDMSDLDAPKVLHILKIHAGLNSEIHSNFYMQLTSGHVTFLADEREARSRLLATKRGQQMSFYKKKEWLRPYEMTTALFDEIANLLIKQNASGRIEVERISNRKLKDRFSALEYGLWTIKLDEDEYYKRRRRKASPLSSFLFFSGTGG